MTIIRFGSRARNTIGMTALAVLVSARCATRYQWPRGYEFLIIENVSPDVIRVSLDMGDHELLLGRVEPMRRGELRIRPGSISPSHVNVRIRVVAIGAYDPTPSTTVDRTAPLHSDSYHPDELLRNSWRYSGSRIVPLGPRRL